MKNMSLKEELAELRNKANEKIDMNIIKIYHHIIDYFKDNPPIAIELQRLYGENQSILNISQKIGVIEVSEANSIIDA